MAGLRIPFVSKNGESFGTGLVWIFVELLSNILTILLSLTTGTKFFSADVLIDERCICACQFMTSVQSVAKMFHFTMKRKKFQDLIGMWEDSFGSDPDWNRDHMKVERKRVKVTTIVLIVGMASTVIPYCLLPIFPALQAIIGRKLSVQAVYPYDVNPYPVFEATLIFQTVSGWVMVFKMIAYDTLFLTLASLQIVQLKMLKHDLGKVFDGVQSEMEHGKTDMFVKSSRVGRNMFKYSSHFEKKSTEAIEPQIRESVSENIKEIMKFEVVSSRLKSWVIHHQQAIRFGNELQALYSLIWAVLFSTSLHILLFAGYITVAVSLTKIQYILCTGYVFSNSIQLYLLCQCGDRLKQESSVLSEDGFSSAWYQCPKAIRNSMKIIFQQAQVHLELSAFGVVPLSSETFQWIVKTAASYFTALLKLRDG